MGMVSLGRKRWLFLFVTTAAVTICDAGFYADNGLDRTISYRSLPKQEKREMENEILNLLGLDHRPKPKIHQTSNSAPKYLIDLYNQLDPESTDRNSSMEDVDFVVSFVNHHNNEDDELSIEPKLHFDVSDISPAETVIHAALNLYRRDTRRRTEEIPEPDLEEVDSDEADPVTSLPAKPSTVSSSTASTSSSNDDDASGSSTAATESTTAEPSTSTSTASSTSTADPSTTSAASSSTTGQPSTTTQALDSQTTTLGTVVTSPEVSSTSTGSSVPVTDSASSAEQISLADEVGSGQEAVGSRKVRSVSPPLDYQDGFQFFEFPFEIQVFTIRHGNTIGEIALEPVATYLMGANETGWIRLNSTNPLLNWVAFPGENFGLVVRLIDPESGLQLSPAQVGLVMGGTGEFAPFMAAFMKEGAGGKRRSTRASEKSRRENAPVSYINDDVPSYEIRHHFSRRNFCQKRTLYVSFRDLGWQDWIIAPDGYSAFYCDGECSFPLNMNATNHAIVQTLVHLVSPGQAPTACCAPTKLAPIMVLYFDDNSNVILKKYKNMVVRSCGCH